MLCRGFVINKVMRSVKFLVNRPDKSLFMAACVMLQKWILVINKEKEVHDAKCFGADKLVADLSSSSIEMDLKLNISKSFSLVQSLE